MKWREGYIGGNGGMRLGRLVIVQVMLVVVVLVSGINDCNGD